YSDERLDNFFATRAFENVSVFSKDGSIKLTGAMLHDLLNPLRDYQDGKNKFEEMGIPAEVSEILLQNDESFYRQGFSTLENAQEISNWFLNLGYHVRTDFDPTKPAFFVDVDLKGGKFRLDAHLFEDPILHRLFIAYPQVKDFLKGKSYTIIKNKKEIGKDIPWDKLAKELEKTSDRSGVTIQRYKGLGEMSAEQLWETTMNPDTRTLLTVNVENAVKADQIFQMLMGEEVPPRKAYIMAHAKSVTNLDI
ncbi:MAG: gyrase subunit, partial [Dehalococcoidia bacterium]|nr:gyrase subunit [Dehalococcoidia bacterium]